MPFTELKFPPYSFLQTMEPNTLYPDCVDTPGVCIPLWHQAYLAAQIYFRGFSILPETNPIIWLSPIPAGDPCPTLGSTVSIANYPIAIYNNQLHTVAPYQDLYGPNSFNQTMYLNKYMAGFNFENLNKPIMPGDCFKWVIIEGVLWEGTDLQPNGWVRGCTNCFVREQIVDCYMGYIAYRCNEDTHGFAYEADPTFHNIAQLPFYLKNPQFESEEDSYRKSDGTFIKLFERMDEVVELETDWRPYDFHRKMKVALGSDKLSVFNNSVLTQTQWTGPPYWVTPPYVCRDPYEIEWNNDMHYRHAKARTKLKTSMPLLLTNNNCNV